MFRSRRYSVMRTVSVHVICLAILLTAPGTARARLTTTEHIIEQEETDAKTANNSDRSLLTVTDHYGMTFVDVGGVKRDCTWLKAKLAGDTTAKTTYCTPPAGYRTPLAATICPKTCGLPAPAKCEDTSSYIGTNKNGRIKKCKWIRAKQKRLDKYCSSEAGINKRADAACPKTCGKCNATPSKPTPGDGDGGCQGGADPRYKACNIGPTLSCTTDDGTECRSLTSRMQCAEDPKQIKFKFSGGQCFQSSNTQDGQMRCMSAFSGMDGLNEAVVTILGTGVPGVFGGSNHLYYTRTIKRGDEFTVKGTCALPDTPLCNLRKQMTVVIQDKEGKVRQSMKIQMDCGKYKIAYGDTFGALQVMHYTNDKQGTVPTAYKVNYKYKLENQGQVTAAVSKFDSRRNGVYDNLLSDMAGVGGEPLVNVCDSVEVVKTDTIDLSKRSSYFADLAVDALNEAGLGCGGSASVSFTAGDGS